MLLFPNCKINIGLQILNKRDDGFHNLETVFYPVGLKDIVEIIQNYDDNCDPVILSQSGIPINVNPISNLCIKAYYLLKNDFPDLPSVKLHLHKTIPIGAGLGGGSADGAMTLILLNQKFNLQISNEKLLQYAAILGSDCPFFIVNKPCLGTGKGELLNEIGLNMSGLYLFIVNPGIHIDTAWAFSQLKFTTVKNPYLQESIQKPIEVWKENIVNDFERPVFEHYPALKQIKNDLYAMGAIYASMSGSGSTFYGIFKNPPLVSVTFDKFFTKLLYL